MKEARKLRAGDRYTVPDGDGQTYRVLRVGSCSAVVRAENRERRQVTIEDHRTGKVHTFTPDTISSAITVSPYSGVRLIEEGPEVVDRPWAPEGSQAAPMGPVVRGWDLGSDAESAAFVVSGTKVYYPLDLRLKQ